MVEMKKFKYIFFILILVLLSRYLYKNYIYYKIPYNPISRYKTVPNGFHITKNLPNGKDTTLITHNLKDCKLILQYFSGLKLIPLNYDSALTSINKHKNQPYFTCAFDFNESEYLFVDEIYIGNLNIIYISSNKPGFNRGYYKIIDSKFNYNYINKLTTGSQK